MLADAKALPPTTVERSKTNMAANPVCLLPASDSVPEGPFCRHTILQPLQTYITSKAIKLCFFKGGGVRESTVTKRAVPVTTKQFNVTRCSTEIYAPAGEELDLKYCSVKSSFKGQFPKACMPSLKVPSNGEV